MLGKEGFDCSQKPMGCTVDDRSEKKRGSERCPSVELTDYIFERDMPPPNPLGIFIVPLIKSSGLFG